MESPEDELRKALESFLAPITPKVSIAAPDETCVIANRTPKTAAMFFDKVWSPHPATPDEIRMYGDSEFERVVVTYSFLAAWGPDRIACLAEREDAPQFPPGLIARFVEEVLSRQSRRAAELIFERYGQDAESNSADGIFGLVDRLISELLYEKRGLAPPIFLEKDTDYESQYRYGDVSTVVATLSKLGVIDEKELTWEQVLEFRKDVENRRKVNSLVHFFDENWRGAPIEVIQYSLEKKLENYVRGLKKHGVKTVLGTLKVVASSKLVVGAASAGGTAVMLHEPMTALAAAALTVTGCALSISEQLRDLKDFQSSQREIAFVHSLQRLSRPS